VSRPEQADLEGLIEQLVTAGVEFIVIGGAAAVLHGAPITTVDLDILYRATDQNIDRLQELLERLGGTVRDPAGRDLSPTRDHLMAGGQMQLLTRLGPIDVMGRLHDGRSYKELVTHSQVMVDEKLEIRVLDLPTLIEIKTAAARAKDRLMLPVLLALLENQNPDD
jgi:hypothetical protein